MAVPGAEARRRAGRVPPPGCRRAAPLARSAAAALALAAAAMSAPLAAAAPAPSAGRPMAPLVRVPFPQEDGSLTPYTFELGYPLLTLVYDTLLWRDDDGVPQPWLARSVDEAPDGRRVTIRIDERARWHDGVAVTASDVDFTFRLVAERLHPRFTPQLRAVERVDVVDPATVAVTLRHPSPGFRDQPLADLPILPEHLWRDLPDDQTAPPGPPVGSGPYRLVEHRPGERYRFEAVPDYFRGPPAVAALEVPIIRSFDGMVRALEALEVDALPVSLPASWVARLRGATTRVRESASYAGVVLVFNVRRPPFDRPEARRAVAAAVDAAAVARAVGSALAPSSGLLHPASPWAAPAGPGPPAAAPAPAPAATGGAALPPIELLVAENDPVKVEAARAVASGLRRSGGAAEVRAVPYEEFSAAVGEDGGEASFTAAISTVPPLASYDPDYLSAVFGSDPRIGVLNVGGYRSEEFDAAAERVARTPDEAGRRAAVADMLAVLDRDVPALPLLFPTGSFVYRPAVYDGWRLVKGAGLLDKRSFTDPAAAPERPAAAAAPAAPAGSGVSPVGWGAIAVAVAALALAAGALVRGRR